MQDLPQGMIEKIEVHRKKTPYGKKRDDKRVLTKIGVPGKGTKSIGRRRPTGNACTIWRCACLLQLLKGS